MKKLLIIVLIGLLFSYNPISFAYMSERGVDAGPTGTVYEGATEDAFETTVAVTDPTADRTITYPDSSQTVGTASSIGADVADADAVADVVDANAANQACNTTCGIAGCYLGFDQGTSVLVDCADAIADTCACDGAVA